MNSWSATDLIVAILGLSAIIAWHELGHFWLALRFKMKVLRYSVGMGPKLWGFTKNGIEYQLSAIPFGGFVQVYGMTPLEEEAVHDPDAFMNKPRWQRIIFYAAGPGFNYAMAVALYFFVGMAFPGGNVEINQVVDGSAAATAGLQTGDLITRIDGEVMRNENDFLRAIAENEELTLSVQRGEAPAQTVVVTPQVVDDRAMLGVGYDFRYDASLRSANPLEVLVVSVAYCGQISVGMVSGLVRKIGGDDSIKMQGPVAVTKRLSAAVRRGLPELIAFLAFLSVALGLMNLLPIPALDGSKMLILLVESVARRDLKPRLQAYVHGFGFLGLMLMILVLSVGEVGGS